MILSILLNLQNKSFMCLKVWLLQVLKSTFFLNLNPLEKIIILIRKIKYVNSSQPGDLMLSKHWQTSLIKSLNITNVYNNVWKLWTMLLDLFVENSSAGFTLKWLPPTLLCDKVIKLFQRMHQDSIGRDVGWCNVRRLLSSRFYYQYVLFAMLSSEKD